MHLGIWKLWDQRERKQEASEGRDLIIVDFVHSVTVMDHSIILSGVNSPPPSPPARKFELKPVIRKYAVSESTQYLLGDFLLLLICPRTPSLYSKGTVWVPSSPKQSTDV